MEYFFLFTSSLETRDNYNSARIVDYIKKKKKYFDTRVRGYIERTSSCPGTAPKLA